jgi:hypothetical protein
MPNDRFANPYAQTTQGVANLGGAIIQALFPDQGQQANIRQSLSAAEQSLAGAASNRARAGYYGARTGLTNEQANDVRGYREGRNRLSDVFLQGGDPREIYAATALAGDDFLKLAPQSTAGYAIQTNPDISLKDISRMNMGAGMRYDYTPDGVQYTEGEATARNKYNTDKTASTAWRGQDLLDRRERDKPVNVSNGGTVLFTTGDKRIPTTAVGNVFNAPYTSSASGGQPFNVDRNAGDSIASALNGYLTDRGIQMTPEEKVRVAAKISSEYQRTRDFNGAINSVLGDETNFEIVDDGTRNWYQRNVPPSYRMRIPDVPSPVTNAAVPPASTSSARNVSNDPAALAIREELRAGRITQQEAAAKIQALGY